MFPNLPLVVTKMFATGLVATSVDLVLRADTCTGACRVVSVLCVVGTTAFAAFGWCVIIDFNRRFRTAVWTPAGRPQTAEAVKDPIMRALSKLRVRSRCVAAPFKHAISDRPQGKFAKPKEWLTEPQRTERLLNPRGWGLLGHMLRLHHSNAADLLDAYQFTFFPMGNGRFMLNPFINHYQMTTQLVLAVLSGCGPHIEGGTPLATAQVVATCTLQYGFAAYCLTLFPSCDKADSIMLGGQMAIEGTRTLLLLLQLVPSLAHAADTLRATSFYLALLGLFVPLIRKGCATAGTSDAHPPLARQQRTASPPRVCACLTCASVRSNPAVADDAIIVQLITLHRGGKLNRQTAGLALILFFTALFRAVTRLIGMEGAAHAGQATSGAEGALKLTKRAADQGVVVHIADAIATAAADVTEDLFAKHCQDAPDPTKEAEVRESENRRRQRARSSDCEDLGEDMGGDD